MNRNLIIKPSQAQRGATLVELLIALLITGLVFAGVYQIYINTVRSTSVQDQVADMQQTSRVVIDQFMREFRMAGYAPNNPTGTAPILNFVSNPIDLSVGQTLIIRGDFIPDNATAPDTVTYKIDSTTDPLHPTLTRQLNNGTVANFGANIESVKTTFYNSANCQLGTALCQPLDITKIKRAVVQLTVRTDTPDKNFTDPVKKDGYRRRTLTGEVVLRNTSGQAKDTTPPPCPINVTAFITGGCRVIRVTWSRPPDPTNDIAGFFIYYSQSAINTSTSSFVNITNDPNKTSFQYDLSVPVIGSWNIAATSYDSAGNLCDSNAGNGNPPADPVVAAGSPVIVGAPTKIPSSPPNPLGQPSDNQVSVSWGQVLTYTDGTTAAGLAGFRLYRSQAADMSGAVMIANEFALPISQILGGGVNQTTQYDDNAANTVIAGVPSPPLNCSAYYYQVSVLDQCNLESARSTVQSIKPDGSLSPGVTPPDNGKAPPAPAITYLEAGDDTSNIIIGWTVAAPSPSQSTPVGVRIYYRVKGALSWTLSVDIPFATPLPVSDTQIVNGLDPNTTYEVKVAAYDDVATACGDETPSGIDSVFTGSCAPHLDPADAAHRIYPGIGTAGSYVLTDGSAVLGLLSPSAQQYITWVAAPTDCTPDSHTFAAQGYDYKNPPAYDSVAYDPVKGVSANVQFFINDSGGADRTADVRYGTAATGSNPGNVLFPTNAANIDYAPRGIDKFYHFPTDPISPSHLDTARFCDAQYDFKVLAMDGEQYSASSTIPLTIKNGGIEVDPSVPVTSDISTVNDIHQIVRFGIKNTNAVKDLNLNEITLSWDNNNAFLEKLEVLDSGKNLIGQWDSVAGSPTGRVGIGTQLTLNKIPKIQKAGSGGNADKGYIRLTFKDGTGSVTSTIDMRDPDAVASETMTILSLDEQDAAASGTNGICSVKTAGSISVPKNPAISAADTVQDQPLSDTVPSQSPGAIVLNTSNNVTVTTRVTPESAISIAYVKLYYNIDGAFLAAAPARPASAGGGGNYSNSVTGSYNSSTDTWSLVIPATTNNRVWYYIETMDGTTSDPFKRNFDIYPDSGVFVYDQPRDFKISLSGSRNPDAACPSPDQVVASGTVTDPSNVAVSGATVSFNVTGEGGPVSGSVATGATGTFAFTTPYVWTGDATVTATVAKSGFATKSCALPAISFGSCLGLQTVNCN
ncbi:MAG: prepilin-type N-terminal cleavage/methylation domain-containing protein [Nitrospirae bacterium]|nr:prepilin-type N-terminal cleavage/methylation domain-containing protein [Nitrospirota bacterium]